MEGFLRPVIDSCQADGELFVGRCQPMTMDQLQNHTQISASKNYTELLIKMPQANNLTLRLNKKDNFCAVENNFMRLFYAENKHNFCQKNKCE